MAPTWDRGGGLLHGQLMDRVASLPFTIRVILGDLRVRFLAKGRAGRGHRAVARNGRVLLASQVPIEELVDTEVRLRFQVWHRRFLPGAPAEPWGILLCTAPVNSQASGGSEDVIRRARLAKQLGSADDLGLEVGGGLIVAFGVCLPRSARNR
jgi:hypothetical protein